MQWETAIWLYIHYLAKKITKHHSFTYSLQKKITKDEKTTKMFPATEQGIMGQLALIFVRNKN